MKEFFSSKKIEYTSPKSNYEIDDQGIHKFEIKDGEEVIGGAEVEYISKPLPMYLLKDLWIDNEHQGNKYSSKIMDEVESFLIKRKKPGILVEAIIDGDKRGIYAKRGWKLVESLNDSFTYTFNWPKDVDQKILIGWYNR